MFKILIMTIKKPAIYDNTLQNLLSNPTKIIAK